MESLLASAGFPGAAFRGAGFPGPGFPGREVKDKLHHWPPPHDTNITLPTMHFICNLTRSPWSTFQCYSNLTHEEMTLLK